MEVTAADSAQIPVGVCGVRRSEFAQVWAAVEAERKRDAREQESSRYVAGVAVVYRRLARATVRPAGGPWWSAQSPLTGGTAMVYEDLSGDGSS